MPLEVDIGINNVGHTAQLLSAFFCCPIFELNKILQFAAVEVSFTVLNIAVQNVIQERSHFAFVHIADASSSCFGSVFAGSHTVRIGDMG